MPELLENHWAFDPLQIGFPSIAACRAIVLQTPTGLYGFHMSSSFKDAAARALDFRNFVIGHSPTAPGQGTFLFVTAYTEKPVTGYDTTALADWKAEARTFADALTGFAGRRMGYSLSPATGANSSYVRYEHNVGMATIKVAPWNDQAPYIVKGDQGPSATHGWRGQQIVKRIVTAVNIPATDLKKANPQMLD